MRAWLHTPSALGQAVVLLASGLVFLGSRSEWTAELDWALNWALGCTILMGPAAAGLAAWSVTRDYPHTMQRLSWTLRRGDRYPAHLALRTWGCAVTAWFACVLVALLAALGHGNYQASVNAVALLNGPCVLAACAALGVFVATVFRSLAAAPIAAGIVYILALTSSRELTVRVLWDGGATASLWSLTPQPSVLIGSVAANLGLAALLLTVTTLIAAPTRTWPVARLTIASLGGLAGVLALVLTSGQTYYTQAEQHEDSTVISAPAAVEGVPGTGAE